MAHFLAKVKLVDDSVGIVKFIGELAGKESVFCGINITKGKSFNDGTFEKQKIFDSINSKSGRFVKLYKIKKIAVTNNSQKYQQFIINKNVYCKTTKTMAIIRSIGFAPWLKKKTIVIGLELLNKSKQGHNGKFLYQSPINGKPKYYHVFSCKGRQGMYIQLNQIRLDKPIVALVNGYCRNATQYIVCSINQLIGSYFGSNIKIKPLFPGCVGKLETDTFGY
eukprot:36015_1